MTLRRLKTAYTKKNKGSTKINKNIMIVGLMMIIKLSMKMYEY